MKANEFIKKFGLDEAKKVCSSIFSGGVFYKQEHLSIEEIERLVESHKLVERFGGLEKAMDIIINQEANGLKFDSLARAIADVESCHA